MDFLLESNLIKLIAVAVTATGGIFLAVAMGGLLSALVTLGALELSYREKIQKKALGAHFKLPHELEPFLLERYGPDVDISRYARSLIDLHRRGMLVPALAQMEAGSLYRLHYRQICGQLMAVVNNEAMRSEEKGIFTPLTDVLVFLSVCRNESLRLPSEGNVKSTEEDVKPARMLDARSLLDLALREIDGIQASLGSSISQETFPYIIGAWMVLYVPALFISAISLPFSYSGPFLSVMLIFFFHVFVILVATLGGVVLALGSAVFGAVAFTAIDRILASK